MDMINAEYRIRDNAKITSMSDVLFIKTSSLGDMIHHMPAITEARLRRPAVYFGWVVEEAFTPLVRLHPAIDEVIPVATRRWRGRRLLHRSTWAEIAEFGSELRRRHYDEMVDTQGLFKSAAIAWLPMAAVMAMTAIASGSRGGVAL